jgi:NADPH:quinone reductase-like Zn-dependent oxidoreductase
MDRLYSEIFAYLDYDTARMTTWNALDDKDRLRAGQTVYIHGCARALGKLWAQ